MIQGGGNNLKTATEIQHTVSHRKSTKNIFLKFIYLTLIVTFSTQSATAQGLPYLFDSERQQIDLNQYAKSVENMTEDEKHFFETLLAEPVRETADLLLLLETLEIKTKNLKSQKIDVENRILNSNAKNEVAIELPGIGTAKYVVLGYGLSARIFTQVYVYRSNTTYNLIDTNIIDLHQWDGAHVSKKTTRYVSFDQDGNRIERDYITVTKKDGTQELLTEEQYRIKRRHIKMWKEYYSQKNAQLITRTQIHADFIPLERQTENGTPEGTKAFIQAMIDEAVQRENAIKHDHHHTRADFGMNVVNIFINESRVVDKHVLNPYKENSGVNSLLNYVRSIKENTNAEWEHWDGKRSLKTFNTGDFRTTWRSLFFQELLTIPLAMALTPDKPYVGPLLTLVWGVVVGFYNKIYRNAQNYARSPAEKNIVVSLVSISYNYAFGILMFGIEGLSLTTLEGLSTHLFLWINVWISSWAKVKFQAIPIARERSRMVPKELNILGFKIKWGPSDEAQTASNITSAFKFMDLADKTPLFGPAELKLTIGKLLFIGSGFLVHLASIWYTYKHDLPEKKALKEEWMRYHTLRKPFLTKEQIKNMKNLDDITLKYPYTDTRIVIPLAGIIQDILETVLMTSLNLAKKLPSVWDSISQNSKNLIEYSNRKLDQRNCRAYF